MTIEPLMSDRRVTARSAARQFSVACLIPSLIATIAWRLIGTVTIWQWYLATTIVAVFAVVALLYRQMPVKGSATIYLACAATMMSVSGFTNVQLAASGAHFTGFAAYKLVAIGVALIVPVPTWIGYFTIGVCIVAPQLQFLALSPASRAAFEVQEPWLTLVYGVAALLFLRYRIKSLELERSLVKLRAEQEALRNLAQTFMALKDLINTPLQSLRVLVTLLEAKVLTQEDATRLLKQTMTRLLELSEALTRSETPIDWATTSPSFDAATLLKERPPAKAAPKTQ